MAQVGTHLSRVELYTDRDNLWRFRAVALNGEIVAVSESYERSSDARDEAERLWQDTDVVHESGETP